MRPCKNKHDCFRCFLSFAGVYSITSQRYDDDEADKTDESQRAVVSGKNIVHNVV